MKNKGEIEVILALIAILLFLIFVIFEGISCYYRVTTSHDVYVLVEDKERYVDENGFTTLTLYLKSPKGRTEAVTSSSSVYNQIISGHCYELKINGKVTFGRKATKILSHQPDCP